MRRILAASFAMMATPALAVAQCDIPPALPKARAEFPPPGSAVSVPTTGHQLVMDWSPQLCKMRGGDKDYAPRCAGKSFGMTLESLRADGSGRKNPEYCSRMGPVSPATARSSYCAMPSVPMMSHAWAKYGSCIAGDADVYFARARKTFDALKWPDFNALSQKRITVGELRSAIAASNPGTQSEMFAIGLTPLGWLLEVRHCLDTSDHPRPCPAAVGGAGDGARVQIWPRR